MNVILVSESTIILNALERCVQGECEHITKLRNLSQLREIEDWSNMSIIFDLTHSEHGNASLLALGAEILACCVVLTRENGDLHNLAPLLGVVGAIMLDSSSLEEVAQVSRLVRAGMHIVPMQMKTMLVRPSAPSRLTREATASLTEKESSVLSWITQGCSNKVIARKMQISDSTVRVHVRSVLRKLGVQNRTQAALIVLDRRGRAPQADPHNVPPHLSARRSTAAH